MPSIWRSFSERPWRAGSGHKMMDGKSMEKMPEQVLQLRSALLNWYPFPGGERALLLGEKTKPLRPLLEAYYTYVAGGMEAGQRYDCIVAVDLLEKTEDVPAFLKTLFSALSANGVLLLGWRNRFGLKYACGGIDEVVSAPFETLQSTGAPRLYARQEMLDLLLDAGFDRPRLFYPMPDAGFAQAVFTDERLPSGSIRDRVFPYDPWNSPFVAAESDLYDDVVREGTLPFVSNYYLAECRKTAAPAPDRHVIYAALSTDRGEEHGFATALYSDDTAEKRALSPRGITALKKLYDNLETLKSRGIPVVEQRLLEDRISMPMVREEGLLSFLERTSTRDREAFLGALSRLWEDVLASSEPGEIPETEARQLWGAEREDLAPILKNALIDMIPYNAFWTGERIRYYDQEFSVANCPARYVMFRALRYTWLHIPALETVFPLEEMKERFGLDALWDAFQRREDRFVGENRRTDALRLIYEWSRVDRQEIRARRERLLHEDPEWKEEDLCRRVHSVQLELLTQLQTICRRHSLSCFALHGTLLGAVRHGGFIPWDDDVDVGMPREDYDRFLAVAEKELPEHLFLQTPLSDLNCFYGGYAKLRDSRTTALESKNRGKGCHQGIWVDILPLDSCPADEFRRKRQGKRIQRWQRILLAKLYPPSTGVLADVPGTRLSVYYLAARCFRRRDLIGLLEREFHRYSDTGCRSILACYYGGVPNRNLFSEADCAETAVLPFENTSISVPKNYALWLTERYGENYMELPPVWRRRRKKDVYLDPDAPYTEHPGH